MDDVLTVLIPLLQTLTKYATKLLSHALQIVYPAINSAFTKHPDLASLALLLIIFYISLLILQQFTRFVYSLTRNLIRLVLLMFVAWLALTWYARWSSASSSSTSSSNGSSTTSSGEGNRNNGPRSVADPPTFDWDATMADLQGFWGFVKNVGGVVLDMIESGKNLEEGDGSAGSGTAWNSGRRATVGKNTGAGRRRV